MKNQRPPLRLGSFELLESRALLAHAGMPQGMFHDGGEQREYADFQRAPAMETTSRSFSSVADHGGFDRPPRNFGGDFNPPLRTFEAPPSSSSYTSSAAVVSVYIPPPQVIVIITLPPPMITSPQFSEPPHSSVYDALDRQTQNASFNNPPPSNLQSSPAPSRSNSNVSKSLDSVSVLSSLALKPSSSESTSDESEDATAATEARDEGQTSSDDQETAALRPAEAAQNAPPTTADESDLIDLDPEELLKRAKRKTTRATTSPQIESKLRESTALREYASSRVAERHSEIWLSPAEGESVLAPINDDLIELLAADQVESTKPTVGRSQPFVSAGASIKLEANLGYYQAIETAETEALPAAVATALPARAAQ